MLMTRRSSSRSSRSTRALTGSTRAQLIIDEWSQHVGSFIKVMPRDYKRALADLAAETAAATVAA